MHKLLVVLGRTESSISSLFSRLYCHLRTILLTITYVGGGVLVCAVPATANFCSRMRPVSDAYLTVV